MGVMSDGLVQLPYCICLSCLRMSRNIGVHWNPVNTDTKGTCHSVRVIRVSVLSGLSKLIPCSTICVHSATRHNIHISYVASIFWHNVPTYLKNLKVYQFSKLSSLI